MAVPGPVTSAMSVGCHEELRERGPPGDRRRARARGGGRDRRGLAPSPGPGGTPRPAHAAAAADPRRRATRKILTAEEIAAAVRSVRPRRPAWPPALDGGRSSTAQRRPATACSARATRPTTRGRRAERGAADRRGVLDPADRGAPSHAVTPPSGAARGRSARRHRGGAAGSRCGRRWTRSPSTWPPSATARAHTVRAYVGDVVSLLDHAVRMGCTEPRRADARRAAQLARPAAHDRRRPHQLGPARGGGPHVHRLGAPRRAARHRRRERGWPVRKAAPRLPGVLRADQARPWSRTPRRPTDDGDDAVALRDRVVLELLYASGIRVGELCGLDVDDVDRTRRVVRVIGKGAKERTVPYRSARRAALDAWLRARPAPPRRVRQRAGAAARRPRRPAQPHHRPPASSRPGPARPACRTSRRTACATPRPPTCSRAAPTCARCRSCSGTPRWPARRSTRTCRASACAAATTRPTRAPDPERAV